MFRSIDPLRPSGAFRDESVDAKTSKRVKKFWIGILPAAVACLFVLGAVPAVLFAPAYLVNLQVTDQSDVDTYMESIATARQQVLLALGGLIATVGVALSLYRHRLDRAADRRAEIRQDLDRDSNWTGRYTEAIGQLGNTESIAIRLGGIYALERLAADSSRDRQTIGQVLNAFIRVSASPRAREEQPEDGPLSADVDAAVTSLGKLSLQSFESQDVALTALELPNVVLSNVRWLGAVLTQSNLADADFRGAKLSYSDFRAARLFATNFSGASLRHVDFQNAILEFADFSEANLAEADLSGSDIRFARFVGANLAGTNFEACANWVGNQFEEAFAWDLKTKWPWDFTPSTPVKGAVK